MSSPGIAATRLRFLWSTALGRLVINVDSKNGLNIVGKRVKLARLRRKPVLTQAQLAQRLAELGTPIDRAGIAKLESGIRCVLDYEVVALAGALEVSCAWLLGKTAKTVRKQSR